MDESRKRIAYGNVYMTVTEMEKRLPLYTAYVGSWKHQYPIRWPNGWPEYQWIQCTGGKGALKLAGEQHEVSAGQGMLLYPNEYHEYYPVSEEWSVRWVSFNGRQAGEIVRSLQFDRSQVLQLSDPEQSLQKMKLLNAVAAQSAPMYYLECSSLVYQLLLDLHRYGTIADVRSRDQHFTQLHPAIQFIEEHAHETISLQDIADQLNVSRYHVCVLFQQTYHMRPFEYVNQIRLRKSRELFMNEPYASITEVAQKCGFDSLSYFIKLFKHYAGVTPKKYRDHYKVVYEATKVKTSTSKPART
ncbi:MAG: AraC family transcriptional regulator [Paenibacillus sp.]|nr:AraC family transcriptional regulator [Paenibacillus sp.]